MSKRDVFRVAMMVLFGCVSFKNFAQKPFPSLATATVTANSPTNPDQLVSFNGKLYFQAMDANNDAELWQYDGKNAPARVADINVSGPSMPQNLMVFNNKLYFVADDGTHGQELFVYTGTGNPTLVKDIFQGGNSGNPSHFCVFNNVLCFQATDSIKGGELWKVDAAGTCSLAAEINTFLNNNNGCGTCSNGSYPAFLTVYNNTLYFSADDNNNGVELWKYDGSTPKRISDIQAGAASSNVTDLVVYNNNLYFAADDGTNGTELWKYDGTNNAPVMVYDINPGPGGSTPHFFTVFKNKLYFNADNAVNGAELQVYDGVNNPALVYDINTMSTSGSFPENLTAYLDTLYFRASEDTYGNEIYKYSVGGNAKIVKDLAPGTNGSFMSKPALFNNKMYFGAGDGVGSAYLYYIDICTSTSTYSVTGCENYTSPSGKYIWTANGTYKDTISNHNGCDSLLTIHLTIKNSPTLTVSSSDNTICSGTTVTLTATPSTSGGAYSWNPGGATTQSIPVTPTTNTTTSVSTFTVAYTLNGCTGNATTSVTVKPKPTLSANNRTVCSGLSATLTATPSINGGTYLWADGGNTTQKIVVSPTNSTTYSVTYTLNGCVSNITNAKVTVNSIPTLTVSSSNATVCSGTTVSFTATPSSSGGGYLWSDNSTTQSITLTPTTNTTTSVSTYTVVYTLNGCSSNASTTVLVKPQPTLTVNNATVCAGNRAVLKAKTNIQGGFFSWTTSSTDSIFVYPKTNSSYSVYYDLNGCLSNTVTSSVTVTPAPTVTVTAATVCAGTTTTLTATSSVSGGNYIWTTGSTTNTIQVQPLELSNKPYVVFYNYNGCYSKGDTAKITFATVVSVTSATVSCPGDQAILTASASTGGGTYSWSNGATTNSITVNPQTSSIYKVVYDNNGCKSDSIKAWVTISNDPHVSVNNEYIVLGASAILTANPLKSGGTYKWLPNNETTNSIEVSPTSTQTYSVIYTYNGCSSQPTPGTVNLISNMVTNTNDNGPGSLRYVIANANDGAVINFAAPVTGTITLTSGEITIDKNLTINGPGANALTISGNNNSRNFYIKSINNSTNNVVINNLSICNGNGKGNGSKNDSIYGGGIFNTQNLTLNNCLLSNNIASGNNVGFGGAIYSYSFEHAIVLTINTCTITGNTAAVNGADENSAARGGGITSINMGGAIKIYNTELFNNSVLNSSTSWGGAICVIGDGINCSISNCAIYKNKVNNDGLEGHVASAGGLVILSSKSNLLIENSTVSSNSANVAGGMALVVANDSKLNINNSTISDNIVNGNVGKGAGVLFSESDGVYIRNTIFNNNDIESSISTIFSGGNNICSDNSFKESVDATATGDKNNTNPMLGPLAYNGGLTQTHALQIGSPAIDAGGTGANTPFNDQRGYCRNGTVDIGAFEFNGGAAQNTTQNVTACNSYLWNSTTYTVSGTYTHTVSNGTGCYDTQVLNLTINPNPKLSARFLNETAAGANDAYAEIVTVGGLSPYTYTWNDVGTAQYVRKNMSPGSYTVTVTDVNKCSATATGKLDGITVPPVNTTALSISVLSENVSEPLKCDGSATITVTGGTPTYTITCGNKTTTGNKLVVPQLCNGFYTVIAKDAAGKTQSNVFVLASAQATFTNTATSTPTGTITSSAISDCNINYADIGSIKILTAENINNTYQVTWQITYTTSAAPTNIVQSFPITSTTGYVKVVLELYCSQRSGSEFVKAVDYINLDNIQTNVINELQESGLSIYPNPFNNKLFIENQNAPANVSIKDTNGKVIISQNINIGVCTIDTSILSAGVYFVSITNNNGVVVKKLIKG